MASLNSLYIKKETLETILKTLDKKGEKGIEITISINDETNQYGQNTSAWVSQTKEQIEQKSNKFYVGNGRCFWTDGKISKAKKINIEEAEVVQTTAEEQDEDEDLPF